MPETISEEYRQLNLRLHESNPDYGTTGAKLYPKVIELVEGLGTKDVLDYGCGKGTLQMTLPFQIRQYDPAIKGREAEPYPADIVVCTDVLEHIEPRHIYDVLAHLESLTRKVFFCTVATEPAKKILADGRNAHVMLRPVRWWVDELMERWEMAEFMLMGGGHFMFTGMKKSGGVG